ncbi:hypothetical protein AVL56_00425 [Alteromonas stellipolaris]|nr:hypothetical protein AVL56_00425 [Alteromonas stellipolaris]ANB25571.1 hypothetical protein A6F57_10395 [Alteromonas stellipolaris]
MEEDRYKYRRYKPRDNKYLSRVYLCTYGGFALGIFADPILGALVFALGVYFLFIWACTTKK